MTNSGEALIARLANEVSRFLESLSESQLPHVALEFSDVDERRRWYYTPVAQRGLSMSVMTAMQRQAVFRLLSIGLTEQGYNHASMIIGMEHVLDYMDSFPDLMYGDTQGTRLRDPGNYRVAVFGSPTRSKWSWRIGGHHLSIHFTVSGHSICVTPAFFGVEPARLKMPGAEEVRLLAAEEDIARNLLLSLTPSQLRRTVISPIAPTDIVQMNASYVFDGAVPTIGGSGPAGQELRDELGLTTAHDEMYRYTAQPKGIAAAAMSDSQREMMRALLRLHIGRFAEPIQRHYDHLFEPEEFAVTTFAWAGSSAVRAAHYYRIQGRRVLIEYDCAQSRANHSHSVWRDQQGDFGHELTD